MGGRVTNEVIFQFSDFEDEDAEFVGDIGDIIIAFFTPYGELFSDFLPLTRHLPYQLMSHARDCCFYQFNAPHEGFFHLDELSQSFCQFRRKCSCRSFAETKSKGSSSKESATLGRRLRRGRRLNLRGRRRPRLT